MKNRVSPILPIVSKRLPKQVGDFQTQRNVGGKLRGRIRTVTGSRVVFFELIYCEVAINQSRLVIRAAS